jgi:pilus assembly protein CpaE
VLLAPLRPEEGDSIRGEHMQRVLNILKQRFQFTLVDTWPSYDERVLAVLEIADTILVPIGPDLPAMKNLNSFLRVARLLNYDMDKIVPVLMRANSVPPGHLKDLETFLKQELKWRVVSDGKRATAAANTGTPFVLSGRDSQISQNIFELARFLAGDAEAAEDAAKLKPQPSGRFWKR